MTASVQKQTWLVRLSWLVKNQRRRCHLLQDWVRQDRIHWNWIQHRNCNKWRYNCERRTNFKKLKIKKWCTWCIHYWADELRKRAPDITPKNFQQLIYILLQNGRSTKDWHENTSFWKQKKIKAGYILNSLKITTNITSKTNEHTSFADTHHI